jgi:gliding motility-associated-like protein
MKFRLQALFAFMLFAVAAFAQPAYNDCQTPYDVGYVPFCDSATIFTNIDATASNVAPDAIPTCFNGGSVDRDVWISFNASLDPDFIDYNITVSGIIDGATPAMLNPQVAVYRGECPDEMYELLCEQAQLGTGTVSLNVFGLTPGFQYFLRINDYSATATPNAGAFILCIDSIKVASGIGNGGTNADFGDICDDGGLDSNYTDNQNYLYQICPASPHQCLVFELDYYNIEASSADQLQIWDGDTTDVNSGSAQQLANIGTFDNNPITWGAASQTYYSSSGCVTLEWSSNGSGNYEGFCSNWAVSNGPCPTFEGMNVTLDPTEQNIIDALASPQTELTITDIDCPQMSIGTFTTEPDHPLGMDAGITLSSGSVTDLEIVDVMFGASSVNGGGGDADLDALSAVNNGAISQDACIIELDVYAYSNQVAFEYIFGSEEYPFWAESNYNDIFALMISGPGIPGVAPIAPQENLALVPWVNQEVSINTVNAGENWQYYRSNFNNTEGICLGGLTTDTLSLIKKSLTAFRQVIPCNTYHLKFAIADRGDSSLDSAVFVSEISAGIPVISIQFSEDINYLVENCVTATEQLIVSLPEQTDDTVTFDVEIGGTATLGLDYILNIPPTITFFPGMQSIAFPLTVVSDDISEADEAITIQLTNDFGCGIIEYANFIIPIIDSVSINIAVGEDTVFMCAGSTVTLDAGGGNPLFYVWSPAQFIDGPPFGQTVNANPPTDMYFYVTGAVGTCAGADSVYVQVITPTVSALVSDNQICDYENTVLTAVNNVSDQGVQWFPSDVANPTGPVTNASPNVTTTYTASVTIAGCTVTDTVTVFVDEFIVPNLTTLDTGICQTYSVILAGSINNGELFSWSPTAGLNDPTIANATATPDASTAYTLTVTSENNFCSQVFGPVVIDVTPAEIAIDGGSYYELCLGETLPLQVTTNLGTSFGLSWNPVQDSGTLLNPTFSPTESTTYYATLNLVNCIVYDSVVIRVDSLPTAAIIIADPDKPVYCLGDQIVLQSTIYEPVDYPDMTFNWAPSLGNETPVDQWNLVVTATESTWYTRQISNVACAGSDSIYIEVVEPNLYMTPLDTTICVGEPVQFIIFTTSATPENISWSPTEGLSCIDCATPIATTQGTITYDVTAEVEGCPVSTSGTINVEPITLVSIAATPDQTEYNQGVQVILNASTNPDVNNASSFVWTDVELGTQAGDTSAIQVTIDAVTNTYTVLVTTPNGCTALDSIVLKGAAPTWQIPNSFTPNNDATNDVFNIILGAGSNVAINRFQVYDRWGLVVYEGITGWDGKKNGIDQPSDLYNYIIELGLPDNTTKEITGELYLIR